LAFSKAGLASESSLSTDKILSEISFSFSAIIIFNFSDSYFYIFALPYSESI